ncbi:MAG: competence/damage-inducible protein A [Chloroflexi bacterium]|nr:MAG: competence/damage-inducible protein A [Chloroflexota bacterium]
MRRVPSAAMAGAPGRSIIIAVGDEVLGGFVLDSNSNWLAQRLREAGYAAERIEVVADRDDAIVAAIRRALAETAVTRILVSGGVGPTPDDRTLAAVARALDRPLEENAEALAHVQGIVRRMHAAGWVPSDEISAANRRMTVVPRGAVVLTNRRGMAPGLAYDLDQGGTRWLLVLPGIPREMTTIFAEEALPRLFSGGAVEHVAEARYGYAIEAEFVGPMTVLGNEYPDVAVGSYPQTETRELVIRLWGGNAAQVEAAFRRLLELRPLAER